MPLARRRTRPTDAGSYRRQTRDSVQPIQPVAPGNRDEGMEQSFGNQPAAPKSPGRETDAGR